MCRQKKDPRTDLSTPSSEAEGRRRISQKKGGRRGLRRRSCKAGEEIREWHPGGQVKLVCKKRVSKEDN